MNSDTPMPSTPAAPLFCITRSYASHRLPRSHTASISPPACASSAFVRATSRHVSLGTAAQPPPDSVRTPLPALHLVDDLLPSSTVHRDPARLLAVFTCSALRPVPAPTMASADFCTRIPTPLDVSSTLAPVQISPGIAHPPSRLCLSDLRRSVPCKFRALTILATSPRLRRLVSASCSSGQRFAFGFLQIRSHPRHPCRSANSSPCRASRGLSPPSKCALPGAPKKTQPSGCVKSTPKEEGGGDTGRPDS